MSRESDTWDRPGPEAEACAGWMIAAIALAPEVCGLACILFALWRLLA